MKIAAIKRTLQQKVDDWLQTITDSSLRSELEANTIVSGGSIASMLLDEEVNDFDLHFRTRELTAKVAQYYISRLNINGYTLTVDENKPDQIGLLIKTCSIQPKSSLPIDHFPVLVYMEDGIRVADGYLTDPQASDNSLTQAYFPVSISTRAITLTGKLQLILCLYGKPHEIHARYDFVHCTNYWDHGSRGLVLQQAALESLLTRNLQYIKGKYPVRSLMRLQKFIRRGWTIDISQIIEISKKISKLDLEDSAVIKDQIAGLYGLYSQQD